MLLAWEDENTDIYLQNLGGGNCGPQPTLRKIADFSRIDYDIDNA
jgi:hypothetical protein